MNNLTIDNKKIGVIQGNYLGYYNAKLPDSPLSNFYFVPQGFYIWIYPNKEMVSPTPVKGEKGGHKGKFVSVEQVFAFGKAYEMGDKKSMGQIYKLQTKNSVQYKELGRKVRNYNDSLWQSVSFEWMKIGMMAKFDQDEFSKKALLATKKLNLIEANPNDNQWGGHCSLQDDFTKATGLNKQGKLLMEVRNTLSN